MEGKGSMNKNVIAENIIRVRKRSGMSQKELAEMIGTKQQQMSQWESGNRIPKIDTILKISNVLSCSPKEICPVFENESECIYSAYDIFNEIKKRLENAKIVENESAKNGQYQKASEAHGAFTELVDILKYFGQET